MGYKTIQCPTCNGTKKKSVFHECGFCQEKKELGYRAACQRWLGNCSCYSTEEICTRCNSDGMVVVSDDTPRAEPNVPDWL